MVGSKEGVLGMERGAVLHRFLTGLPARFVVDEGKWHLHGLVITIDDANGRATKLEKIRMTEEDWLLM
jgi:calcineurin-like phosphoesterase